MPGPIFQSSSIYTGEGQFYFILQLDINRTQGGAQLMKAA